MRKKAYRPEKWISFLLVSMLSCTPRSGGADGMANLGTHKLHYMRMGTGLPTLVLDVGFAETYSDWMPVLEEVAGTVSVVAYDRAGYGESEPGPLPRDCNRAAEELHMLLYRLKVQAPVILLGHSLGAMNMQVFAHQHPEKVGGIILIDPPPVDWLNGMGFPRLYQMAEAETESMQQAANTVLASSDPDERTRLNFLQTIASEHEEMLHRSAVQVAEIASFGDIPLFVIASEKPNEAFGEDAVAYQRFWNKQCKNLAYKSLNGDYLLAGQCSHHVHLDAPDIVIRAIKQMASKLKK